MERRYIDAGFKRTMAGLDHHIKTLHQSEGVALADYRCWAKRGSCSGEEAADCFELVFPRRGLYERVDRSGRSVADANRVLLFAPGRPFRINHPIEGGDASTLIQFEAKAWFDLVGAVDPGWRDRNQFQLPAAIPAEPADQLLHSDLLRRLGDRTNPDPLEVSERIAFLGERILTRASEEPQSPPRNGSSDLHLEIVRRTKQALVSHAGDRLTLSFLARQAFSSPFHLCRVFRRETGMPIFKYLQRLRVHLSLDLLLESRRPIGEVGMELGFASPSHFSTAFRREMGMSPRQFRRGSGEAFARDRLQRVREYSS